MKRRCWFSGQGHFTLLLLAATVLPASSTVVPLGAGGYLTTAPKLCKPLPETIHKTTQVQGPVRTGQWWSSLLWQPYSQPMYAHPLALQALADGLAVSYPGARITANKVGIFGTSPGREGDLKIGHTEAASFARAECGGYSDWFVTTVFDSGTAVLRTSFGHGSPFVFCEVTGGDPTVTFPTPPQVWSGTARDAVLGVTIHGHHYGLFGPSGSTWSGLNGTRWVNDSQGKSYFTVALLPDDKPETLARFRRHAYNEVIDTRLEFSIEGGMVKAAYQFIVQPREDQDQGTLFALYPHQWKYATTPLTDLTYGSVRGLMKVAEGHGFQTIVPVQGVLPFLPPQGISRPERLLASLQAETAKQPARFGDTYWEGKHLGKLTSLSGVAEAAQAPAVQRILVAELKRRLEAWFTALPDKEQPVFYYDAHWGTLVGSRPSFGSDRPLNDHHFHYGYFIRAAAEVARLDPAWVEQWGPMVRLLIRDIASPVRSDPMFPYLRCFDLYAGHSWASGDANFADGNNQESSSEAMNAWYGLMLWGEATGDRTVRDLGVFLFNTERTAIEEYWFDVSNTTFPPDFPQEALGMVWGGKGVFETWFSPDIDCIHGINWLPFTPASLYLGRHPDYVKRNHARVVSVRKGGRDYNSGWGDLVCMFGALQDPAAAAAYLESNPNCRLEAGNTHAFMDHWIGTLQNLGLNDASVTADHPLSGVFNNNGRRTYAAYHFGDQPLPVSFSDGTALLAQPRALTAQLVLRTDSGRLAIDGNGSLSEIRLTGPDRNSLAPGQPAPLVSLRVAGQFHRPSGASWDAARGRVTLHFGGIDTVAILAAQAKPTHVVFELVEVKSSHPIEMVLWGPYPTTIGDIIGETVGVVRDAEVAVGIQALNAKTLGGDPTHENDIDAGYGADDPGTYADLPPELNKEQHFRGTTARQTEYGSVLQAYCRNRDQDRVIANWGHDRYVAPSFADGGIVGSKIALFVCPSAQALQTIGAIEVAEGLPHPLLDGVWGKVSPAANGSYLIVDFAENNIEHAVQMTRRAGLHYLYHSSPFETWGHFKLKPDLFPHGWEGFRSCVETARKAGVRLGFHTLSNFITPNDSYVTPKPDPRLARIGESPLAAAIDAVQVQIPVESPDFFRKATTLNTVMIGGELIRYGSVSAQAPWRLLECQRGAWGTQAAPHQPGDPVAKLMDHSYQVFLTDADLSREVARHIARFCNETGARQLSFDGLEGNWSTGMGQYGRTLFTQAWYDALSPELRGQIINDASNPGHFNWHIYTRMNWGEPWYAGFRESQTLYRFKNQLYFERNLMPRMLGWFALRPDTSLEDAEWLLARAAGFDAGFTLATSLASTAQLQADPHSAEAARQFGAVPAILEAIQQWETARMARAFPADVQAALRDNTREFHLEPVAQGRWDLHEFHLRRFAHDITTNAPTACRFRNPYEPQPLQWSMRNAGKNPLSGLTITIAGKRTVDLQDQAVPAGGALRYLGGESAMVCDPAWREIGRVPVNAEAARVGSDEVNLSVACRPQPEGTLKLELRTLSPARRIGG